MVLTLRLGLSVAWSDVRPPGIQMGADSILWSGKTTFVETGDEIISTAIPSLLLSQAGQLSVTGEKVVH